MSKKGFYDVLGYIKEHPEMHYNDVLRYLLENKIISSRASVTIILNGLTDLGVLERNVSQDRPIRTTYKVSRKGNTVLKHMKELEVLFV